MLNYTQCLNAAQNSHHRKICCNVTLIAGLVSVLGFREGNGRDVITKFPAISLWQRLYKQSCAKISFSLPMVLQFVPAL